MFDIYYPLQKKCQLEMNNVNIKILFIKTQVTHEVKQYLMDLACPKEVDEQEKSAALIKQVIK